ncbi:MAG: hypothetical protein EXS37_12155 [Opitutus sp.]|nr:hypothetical protein [Opitutus sp.]
MNYALNMLPAVLIFTATFLAARPTKERISAASWLAALLAVLTGIAFPVSSIIMWGMGAAMSAGTQTGLPLVGVLLMLSPLPYYLWVAITIAPLRKPSRMRAWHLKMHFGYAVAYLLVRTYTTRGGFYPIIETSAVSIMILLWYRLVEAQERKEANLK